jgi:hypothetical protein
MLSCANPVSGVLGEGDRRREAGDLGDGMSFRTCQVGSGQHADRHRRGLQIGLARSGRRDNGLLQHLDR